MFEFYGLCIMCALTMVAMRNATNNRNARSARNEKLIRITNVILNIRTWVKMEMNSIVFRLPLPIFHLSYLRAQTVRSPILSDKFQDAFSEWLVDNFRFRLLNRRWKFTSKKSLFFCWNSMKKKVYVSFTGGFRMIRIHKVCSIFSRHATATCCRGKLKFCR